MATDKLKNLKVAILATNGFEESELVEPRQALDAAGATTHIISPQSGEITAWDKTNWGGKYKVDSELNSCSPSDYHALLLPGGVINPDQLRVNGKALEFIKHFFNSGKPVAVICHGPQTLIDAGVVKGRKITSYASVKNDLINAGANWVDQEVVEDGNMVSSRKPDDLPAFCKKTVEKFAQHFEHA